MSRAWMPIYWGDYLRDTLDLNTTQHGAYLLLIAHYWMHGGLPTDDTTLRKISKVTRHKWPYIRQAVASKFMPGWKHKRIEEELLKAEKRIMQRVLAGQKGGTKSGIARTIAKRPLAEVRSKNEAAASQKGKQPATNHKEREITTSLPSAAREADCVDNSAVGPATAPLGSAPSRPPPTTNGEAKQASGLPTKQETKLEHEKRLIGPAEYWGRVASRHA